MPIYVPPISRRQFLAGVLAAGASLPHWSFGDELDSSGSTRSPRYLFISDVHVGAHMKDEKHHVQPAIEYSRAIDQILALKERPRHIIAAGDYAISRGNPDNCKMFHKLTSRLSEAGMDCHFALGNHDSRKTFLDEFPGAKELIDPNARALGKLVYVLETPRANWFFLDSLHAHDINLGVLGEAQLNWLAAALDARRDKPALIVGHHDPLPHSDKRDTAAFYAVITRRRQVKAYIFGHTHAWGLAAHDGIHLVNIPTTAAWPKGEQSRGFLTATLHEHGMALKLHTLGHKKGEEHELTWRKA
jgi:3',5'-cyclic-AMP phosphodiesterase